MRVRSRQAAGPAPGWRTISMACAFNRLLDGMLVAQIGIYVRLVRELMLRVLCMDPFLVQAIAPGSFYLRPLFFPHPCLAQIVWKLAWLFGIARFLCAQSLSRQLRHLPFLSGSVILRMPHRRGVSRRGVITGNRGRTSRSVPQNVIPITSASPSSPPSGHAGPLPHNSFQTTWFTFHSRLNRPVFSASITVIFAEEEENANNLAHTTTSQSQEDSVLQGEMAGVVFNADNMQDDTPVSEAPPHPADSTQNEILACGPTHCAGSILNLVTPPEGGIEGIEDNGFVTWVASSSQVDKDMPDSPQHAD